MRIIPALDIINGKCVRLSKGDYSTQKVYDNNPLDIAKRFEDHGIQYLHVVDLDGARSSHIVNYKTVEAICTKTNLKVDFGGGIKSDEDVKIAFESGVRQITGGSIAVKNRALFKTWLSHYGNDKIILGADCSNRKIATTGWLETSDVDVIDFITQYEQEGVSYVICTDISKDGMLQGTATTLYREIKEKTEVKLIASGGVSSIEDIEELKAIGCEGVIIGKAYYEGKITLKEIQELC